MHQVLLQGQLSEVWGEGFGCLLEGDNELQRSSLNVSGKSTKKRLLPVVLANRILEQRVECSLCWIWGEGQCLIPWTWNWLGKLLASEKVFHCIYVGSLLNGKM